MHRDTIQDTILVTISFLESMIAVCESTGDYALAKSLRGNTLELCNKYLPFDHPKAYDVTRKYFLSLSE